MNRETSFKIKSLVVENLNEIYLMFSSRDPPAVNARTKGSLLQDNVVSFIRRKERKK